MGRQCEITIDGNNLRARRGDLLLDAALKEGIELPYDCRSGHCGTCCVKIVSGDVQGGKGAEPGIVHACQCRLTGDAVFKKVGALGGRTVDGVVSVVRPLTADVMEVGITTERALPHLPGQYARIEFAGYPGRSYSITHSVFGHSAGNLIWFHIRRFPGGRVSSALGQDITHGHPVRLSGPLGSSYFRPAHTNRTLLVATNTGFAPVWSIAVAALHENPQRALMIVAGGRSLEALYMAPALERLAIFPNVRVVTVCSSLDAPLRSIMKGRPTDYLPHLLPTDVVYTCGAPGMVDAIRSTAAHSGAVCYADPFLPASDDANKAQHGARSIAGLARRVGNGLRRGAVSNSGWQQSTTRSTQPIGRSELETST